MKAAWIIALSFLGLAPAGAGGEPPRLRIVAPVASAIMTGRTRLEASVTPPAPVRTLTFFVDGRPACTVSEPPFTCVWEAGDVVRPHHVRVVATLVDGARLVENVRTKDIGYAERVRTEAVLVPVVVTDRGHFVRGLRQQDFEIVEDGAVQSIASFAAEDTPLDLVLAIDISGSMEGALGD